jgi:signal transduction histidine kinase/CheY-like chemotaxis protein
MPTIFEPSLSFHNRRQVPVGAVTVGGVLLAFMLFFTIRTWEHRVAQAAVESAAKQRVELLRESLGNSLEVLYSLGSLYDAGRPVDRQQFARFVADALARRSELLALSWTPRVPAGERASYERAVRAEGYSDFQFTEHDPVNGRMVRARDQPEYYYPVYFIEPLSRNQPAFGYDLNARLDTLSRACDAGRALATPPSQLMQEQQHEPGFIVYLPLFAGPAPTTVAARRLANTGFVAAVFQIADLVGPALARQPGLLVALRDATADTAATSYVAPPAGDAGPSQWLSACEFSLPFAGREWRIKFTPTVSFAAGGPAWQSWAALVVGLALTALLAAYLHASARRATEIARANAVLQVEVGERKRAEEAAAAASRAKSEFLACLSHEIRTPLNAILGYTQILERDTALPPRHRDAVRALANSGHHLLGLLNSILDFSKIEAGRMQLQRDVFAAADLVEGIAGMFKLSCAEKNLTLRVACADGGATFVRGDEGKLRQVLINLLGNAIKFTPRGEIFVSGRLVDRDRWIFEVRDTGIGLTPEECAGLFEPFHQTAAGRRQGGTGLGLAIARGHVELMGGNIEVQSAPGLGTRFAFTLPLPAAVELPRPEKAGARLPRLAPEVAVSALVIDDNGDNRHILARLLAEIGCAVAEAATTASARDIARQSRPDIVFIDVRLADTTGPELLAMLRTDGLPVATPVLFHTATMLDRAQREGLIALGADLLAKPFRTEEICAGLRRLPSVRFAARPDVGSVPEPAALAFEGVVLPEALGLRMSEAAELHRTTVVKACVEELHRLGGPAVSLAEYLRQLLRAYDLPAITRVVDRLRLQSRRAA